MSKLSAIITNDDGSTIAITADNVAVVTHEPPPPPRTRVLLGTNAPAAGQFTDIGIVRRYATTDPKAVVADVKADLAAGVHTILSVGPQVAGSPYKPANMEPYRAAFESPNVMGVPWHEPENDNVSPADWRTFYSAFCQQFPKCPVVLPVLMGWTFGQNKASLWLNGLSRMDFVGADPYVHDGQTVAAQYDPARLYAEAAKKQLVIAETGLLAGKPPIGNLDYQSVGLAAIHSYVNQYPSVYAVCYWSAVGKTPYDWRLTGNAIGTFQNLLKSPPFAAE